MNRKLKVRKQAYVEWEYMCNAFKSVGTVDEKKRAGTEIDFKTAQANRAKSHRL